MFKSKSPINQTCDKILQNIFFNKTFRAVIIILCLTIIFFSIRLIFTFDSAHYLSYVEIFEGNLPTSSWDIVRGPIFPLLIFLSNTIFGKTSTGFLICTFLFYLVFIYTCYKILFEICKNVKYGQYIKYFILLYLIFNPLILGYFHVMLTEFVAITIFILNIFITYKWLKIDYKNKLSAIIYALYFIVCGIFCYHLKQPYILIAFLPLIFGTILTLIHHHDVGNILYRLGTIVLSGIFLLLSIITWDKIIDHMGADTNTGRDSGSMLAAQILHAYNITPPSDTTLTTGAAIGIFINELISNPSHIFGAYFMNYCGMSSVCQVESANGAEYFPTSRLDFLETWENSSIAYHAFYNYSNIFSMPDNLKARVMPYGESEHPGLIAKSIRLTETFTNILFKITVWLAPICLLVLIIFRFKSHHGDNVFRLSFLLLSSSASFLIIAAGLGLIIDRYAVESFIPTILGTTSTIIYIISYYNSKTFAPNITVPKDKSPSRSSAQVKKTKRSSNHA